MVLGCSPFRSEIHTLSNKPRQRFRQAVHVLAFALVKCLRLVILQIWGFGVLGCTCILGLGPVYLREILSPFVCVCVVCVYVHACIWRPEVDFRSSFVISVLRHELSSNLERISLGRPAGQQARVPFATLHCKFVPTQLLFTSGATDQTQVLGPVQRALY